MKIDIEVPVDALRKAASDAMREWAARSVQEDVPGGYHGERRPVAHLRAAMQTALASMDLRETAAEVLREAVAKVIREAAEDDLGRRARRAFRQAREAGRPAPSVQMVMAELFGSESEL